MSDIFSAADVKGHTLIARTVVPLYSSANDSALQIGTVSIGNSVGVVYTWLDVSPSYNRSTLWWVFVTASGMYYYTPHIAGRFDVSAIKAAGVLTIDEKKRQLAEAEALANMPWYERLFTKSIAPLAIGVAVILVAPKILESLKKQ